MYIPNELKKIVDKPYQEEITDNLIDNLFQIIEQFFADKHMFSEDDFTIRILDEYILKTNCHKDIFTTLYIEIDQPLNYRPKLKPKNHKPGKFDIPDLYISLSDIRKGITQASLNHFDSNNIIWVDRASICIKSNVMLDDNTSSDYYFRIIPALTYYNENNVRGLVYYHGNDIQIEYPQKFIDNYNHKNKQTKGKYRDIVLILKNILLKNNKVDNLPSEIIETLVYNVPNEFLKGDDKDSMLRLINFIRNHSLKEFKTVDEQDSAFGSIYRGMSPYYCKHILRIIENYLSK